MSSGIEVEIQMLLKNTTEPSLVADELLKKWHRDELSDSDIERAAHFLFTFGFHAALIENLARKIKEKEKIPWGVISRVLLATSEKPTKEIVDNLFIGASAQDALDIFSRRPELDEIDARFKNVRKEMASDREKKIKKLRTDHLNQAESYRNDRMYEKEESCLARLLEYFPSDKEIQTLLSENANRKALGKLEKSGRSQVDEEFFLQQKTEIPKELQEAAFKIKRALLEKASENPDNAYNISMGFFQMGHFNEALDALKFASQNESSHWLKVELLLEARRYLDVLTELDQLEKTYSSDPEIIFSSIYLRAQALWGLRQRAPAISLLESLIKVRPDYRSAHALLIKWREAGT